MTARVSRATFMRLPQHRRDLVLTLPPPALKRLLDGARFGFAAPHDLAHAGLLIRKLAFNFDLQGRLT
jgi:hypothetical protein